MSILGSTSSAVTSLPLRSGLGAAQELSTALYRASGRWPWCRAAWGQRGELQGSFSWESGWSSPLEATPPFVCFAAGGRGAAGSCWMPRAAGCGFAGFARSDPTALACRACSGARAARLRSPPVSGAGAGGLHRDLSLDAGRYRLTRANPRPRRLGTAASRRTGRCPVGLLYQENSQAPGS